MLILRISRRCSQLKPSHSGLEPRRRELRDAKSPTMRERGLTFANDRTFHRKRNELLAEKLIARFFDPPRLEAPASSNDQIPPLIECPAISQVSLQEQKESGDCLSAKHYFCATFENFLSIRIFTGCPDGGIAVGWMFGLNGGEIIWFGAMEESLASKMVQLRGTSDEMGRFLSVNTKCSIRDIQI
ncbi:hypothetical protein K0M31_010947 [Melipona bicolor]|uniref:Uncharacterized protein n=1 Tax=Melipona bicolor TaxID=60889 RepID=A0AA40FKW4_9HYME|nr:hypothetical protein K0M31_010947 [Melipona bicolor]